MAAAAMAAVAMARAVAVRVEEELGWRRRWWRINGGGGDGRWRRQQERPRRQRRRGDALNGCCAMAAHMANHVGGDADNDDDGDDARGPLAEFVASTVARPRMAACRFIIFGFVLFCWSSRRGPIATAAFHCRRLRRRARW